MSVENLDDLQYLDQLRTEATKLKAKDRVKIHNIHRGLVNLTQIFEGLNPRDFNKLIEDYNKDY